MSRMFVCGDIHGCYGELMGRLDMLDFDFERDKLFALGDLVDRGPDNMEVLRLLREPWFDSIKGNHEFMLEMAYLGEDRHGLHANNGGYWFVFSTPEEQKEAYELVKDLPCAMEVITPSGRKIGLVHGDLPFNDWEDVKTGVSSMDEAMATASITATLWGRKKFRQALRTPEQLVPVRNVDMVYMGHTPHKVPVQAHNMRWIDTGACFNGHLTVEELL